MIDEILRQLIGFNLPKKGKGKSQGAKSAHYTVRNYFTTRTQYHRHQHDHYEFEPKHFHKHFYKK